MRSNRDATIFQSIGPSFVLTFPDRGCARIKPRRRIPFDSSAHYYSLLGPITLPLSLVAVPFHSLFFHLSPSDFSPSNEQNDQRSIDEALRKKGGPFFFLISKVSRRYNDGNPAISLFFLFSFRTEEKFLARGKHRGSMLNEEYGKIFERGKFGLRDYFSAFYISCVVGFELLERCYSL